MVTVLSTADFDSAVWTNKQHLAVGLAEDDLHVNYIESLGLRRPGLNRSDLKRIASKLTRGSAAPTSASRQRPHNLHVFTPLAIPVHGSRPIRRANHTLVHHSIQKKIKRSQDPGVLWTFSPLTYGLEKAHSHTIYHSVDLLHELPGVPRKALLDAERRLLDCADVVIASSEVVKKHLEGSGRKDVLLWENVAHTEIFADRGEQKVPRAIFAGNLTPSKLDFQLLRDIATRGVPVTLAGPIAVDGAGGGTEIAELLDHPQVTYLGNLDLEALAAQIRTSMVGLVPYKVNGYTAGVFPMKVYEYLAGGLAVVSTALPSLASKQITGLEIVPRGEFAHTVSSAIARFDREEAALRSMSATRYSWKNRLADVRKLLGELHG
ncbi:glycosyltransferase family protein [Rhodococcus opacus]|uniref:glycosyltransferase n=1 Tax=Rhodococcus opacus TaxID=37919 RepID=UPI002235BC7B|nr:glycosyltransferase [Rhodococcus opacus]UZG57425.1 glycosyltransferase [Rhodococcus opacus]